jgi:hypothetical protein
MVDLPRFEDSEQIRVLWYVQLDVKETSSLPGLAL